jgi:hypothetical protein
MLLAWGEKRTVSITSENDINKSAESTASGASHLCGRDILGQKMWGYKMVFK